MTKRSLINLNEIIFGEMKIKKTLRTRLKCVHIV